jgi:hypothetical protein
MTEPTINAMSALIVAKRWDSELLQLEGHLTQATRGNCVNCKAIVVLSPNSAKRVLGGATLVCTECVVDPVLGIRQDGVPRGYYHAEQRRAKGG